MIYAGNKIVPKPYIKEIELIPTADGQELKAVVSISVTSNWLNAIQNKNISFAVVRITEEAIFGDFTRSRPLRRKILDAALAPRSGAKNEILRPTDRKHAQIPPTEVKTFSLLGKNKTFYTDFVTMKEEFLIPASNPAHLSFFVVSYLSNVDYNKRPALLSRVQTTSELVINGGKVVNMSNVFVPASGKEGHKGRFFTKGGLNSVWTGPAHWHAGNKPHSSQYRGWMAGEDHHEGANQSKLNIMKVANTKIKDYRYLTELEKVDMNLLATSKKPNTYNKLTKGAPKRAIFSDLIFSTGAKDNCSIIFSFNWAEFLLQNVQFPILLSTIDKHGMRGLDISKSTAGAVLRECKIKKMTMHRKKLDTKEPEKERTKQLKVVSDHTGYLNLNSSIYKTYVVQDNESSMQKGRFQYTLEIEFEDATPRMLSNMYREFKRSYDLLADYQRNFVGNASAVAYSKNNSPSPWTAASQSLIKILHATTDNESFTIKDGTTAGTLSPSAIVALSRQVLTMLHPQTATRNSIANVSETYKKVFDRFERALSNTSNTTFNLKLNPKSKSTVGRGNKVRTNRTAIVHTFKQVYDNRHKTPAGYEYLNFSGHTSIMPTYNISEFMERTKFESGRFFPIQKVDSARAKIFTKTPYETSINNMEISYLTPLKVLTRVGSYNLYNSETNRLTENDYVSHVARIAHFKETKMPSIKYSKPNLKDDKTDDCDDKERDRESSTDDLLLIYGYNNNITISDVRPGFFCEERDKEILTREVYSAAENTRLESEADRSDDLEKIHLKTEISHGIVYKPLLAQEADVHNEKCRSKDKLNPMSKNFSLSTSAFKRLPNQLKSLAASLYSLEDTLIPTFVNGVADDASFLMKYKNIVSVEYLDNYTDIKSPQWQLITREGLLNLTTKGQRLILCRLRDYTNSKIGYHKNEFVELPIYNKYFFIDLGGPKNKTTTSANRASLGGFSSASTSDVAMNLTPKAEFMWTSIPSEEDLLQPSQPGKTTTTQRTGGSNMSTRGGGY